MSKKKNITETTETTAEVANEQKATEKLTVTAATREELAEKVAELTADGSYIAGCVGQNAETGEFSVQIERKQ